MRPSRMRNSSGTKRSRVVVHLHNPSVSGAGPSRPSHAIPLIRAKPRANHGERLAFRQFGNSPRMRFFDSEKSFFDSDSEIDDSGKPLRLSGKDLAYETRYGNIDAH